MVLLPHVVDNMYQVMNARLAALSCATGHESERFNGAATILLKI